MNHSDEMARELIWLRRLAARLVGPGADADDLTQETLRVALEGSPTKRATVTREKIRPWLMGIARRLALAGWRDDARRRWREADAAPGEALPSAEDAVASAEARKRLVEAVLDLDEPLRAAVVLRYLEGLGYGDLAQQLGLSQAAARKRVSRGVTTLRERLRPEGGGAYPTWLSALAGASSVSPGSLTPKAVVPAAILMQAKTKWATALIVLVALGGVAITWKLSASPPAAPEMAFPADRPGDPLAAVEALGADSSSPVSRELISSVTAPPTSEPSTASPQAPEPLAAFVRVKVTDGTGRAVPTADVSLRPDWQFDFVSSGFDRFQGGERTPARWDPSASEYRADVSAATAYVVNVAAEGYGPFRREGVQVGDTVKVELQAAAAFECTVRDRADGTPVSGAQVRVFHGDDHIDAWTDASGQVTVDHLTAGIGAFLVSPAEHISTRHTEIELAAGAVTARSVDVDRGWTVSGQVRMSATGAPVANAEVSAWSFEGRTVRTDARGLYEIRGLKRLPGEVVARATGAAVAKAYYRGPSQDLDLLLEPSITLVGQLVDSSGRALPSGLVGHVQWVADSWTPAECDPEGRFRIDGLSPGAAVQLTLRAPGCACLTATVSLEERGVSPGETLDLGTFALEPAMTIEGSLRWASGAPAPLALVATSLDADPSGASTARLDSKPAPTRGTRPGKDGRFFLRELTPGSYEVTIRDFIQFAPTKRVELSVDRPTAEVNWVLPDGFTIEGRVVDPDGEPVPHAFVNLSRPDVDGQRPVHGRSDVDGRFRFEHFQGTLYRLYLSCDDATRKSSPTSADLLPQVVIGDLAESGPIEIVLRAAQTVVTGQVLDSEGQPLGMAYVCRDDGAGASADGVLADLAGRFTISVDGSAETRLLAWATEPFDSSAERQNLTAISYRIQRELLGGPREPLVTIVRLPTGTPTDLTGSGRIVLD